MMTQNLDTVYSESFEYHGNTAIERIRRQDGVTVLRDWLLFDTVEEAETYFHDRSCRQTDYVQEVFC